jgi:hypothetical protein
MVEQAGDGGTPFKKSLPSYGHCAIIAELDELVQTLPPSLPLYSKDLARQIGTSVRTLQMASQSIAGVSLHLPSFEEAIARVGPAFDRRG